MSLCVAEVTEVLPDKGGVRVRFKDLALSGFGDYDFVRVLQWRMSDGGGAALWLPEVGEFGVVGVLQGGFHVWLGSLPYQNKNQVDPSPGLLYVRHQSGVVVQIRKNGDFEVAHPSGCRLTMSEKVGPLDELVASSQVEHTGFTGAPVVELAHPSGAKVEIDAAGNGKLHGFASLVFQDGEKRFSMEGLFDWVKDSFVAWAKTHTHTSAASGSPTSAPIQNLTDPSKEACCSPATFKGPQGG